MHNRIIKARKWHNAADQLRGDGCVLGGSVLRGYVWGFGPVLCRVSVPVNSACTVLIVAE